MEKLSVGTARVILARCLREEDSDGNVIWFLQDGEERLPVAWGSSVLPNVVLNTPAWGEYSGEEAAALHECAGARVFV